MGARASSKLQAGGIMKNAKGKRQKANVILLFALFVCFAGKSFSQNAVLTQKENDFLLLKSELTEQINRGSAEQKRSALHVIRNLESAEASRIAVPALRDSEIIVRATAAFSVIFLPETEAAAVLLPLLGDKAELVRREAAYALGAVGSPAAVNPLLQILERDKVLEVRGAAAVALGQIGDVSAVPALMRILRNRPREREEFIRRSAAKSIGQIAQAAQFHEITFNAPKSFLPDKYKIFQYPRYEYLIEKHPVFIEAANVLIQTLQNPSGFQDFALGAIGAPAALPVLRANFNNPDYYLAEISREAVIKISFKQPE
jgi:HEAT repeat protein